MPSRKKGRPVDSIVADINEAGEAAAELIVRGRTAWNDDMLLKLAGEAVIGRIADAANRLPSEVKVSLPGVPWEDIRDIRILVDHVYHRIDYEALWQTLRDDVPDLLDQLEPWRA
ncbi:MAG: DUF86 domain-containing protein [Actinobacteria bacterium]|nr:DUF86 domain-containing protein [Actinomycetota bacterium]MDQ3533557.1 DUF86 domain-containing protein [Actinomycetota bacterium]